MNSCRDVEPLIAPYVDGEAAPADRAVVDAHLKGCGGCRQNVLAERAARDVLRARGVGLRECASARLHARCAAHARASSPVSTNPVASGFSRKVLLSRRLPLAAAATVLLAVGTVFGLGLNNKVQALAVQMTVDHVKCARFNNSATPADPIAASRLWAAKFGWPLTVPPSSPPAGLELRAVRRCAVSDGRVAHLIYQWHGEPLSVFVLPSQVIDQSAVVDRWGHDSLMWSQNGRTYVVLAGHPRRPELEGVVQYVKANVY